MKSQIISGLKNLIFGNCYWTALDKLRSINVLKREPPRFTNCVDQIRNYAKHTECRIALKDAAPPEPEVCDKKEKSKKPGILNWFKLNVVDKGTNFGTPFWRLKCDHTCDTEIVKSKEITLDEAPPMLIPKRVNIPKKIIPKSHVCVSILGGDSQVGIYAAMLLKQCPGIKRIALFKSRDNSDKENNRSLGNVIHDLMHIDTSCVVKAYDNLELSLQNADIVLMLDNKPPSLDMPVETRFYCQAPDVRKYASAIYHECPKAFVIVAVSPIDCMVPIVCETIRESGWYDPRKVLGSLAVAEMRATTLAARALSLEPYTTRVPCVGGTEGITLVPLFSKAVDFFEFAEHNAELLTETVRYAPKALSSTRPGDLSEAHAYANLVKAVALGLLSQDNPRITGFVETDLSQVVSPARYIANQVEINRHGIYKVLGLPPLSGFELTETHIAITELNRRLGFSMDWYNKCNALAPGHDMMQNNFFYPERFEIFDDCASQCMMS